MSKKNLNWQRWLRDILLVVFVIVAIQWWQSRHLPQNRLAPSLVGPSITGQPMALNQHKGKPVLVHFWATWCPICRLQDTSIARIAKDHTVITVATNSGDRTQIQAYLDTHDLAMPVMLDESGQLAQRWEIQGVPTTFVINRHGEITYATTGYSTEIGLRFRLALAK